MSLVEMLNHSWLNQTYTKLQAKQKALQLKTIHEKTTAEKQKPNQIKQKANNYLYEN
jgi:hypothetical protein